jgi:hypothetical protein
MDSTTEQQADVFDFGVKPPQGAKAAIRFAGPGGVQRTRQVVGVEDAADRAKAERWLRRHQFAVSSLPADVLNALMARYEAEIPVFVSRRLTGRLVAIYRHVLDRTMKQDGPDAVAVDVPHLEAVTDENGRRTVRIVPERFDANQIAESVRGWIGPLVADGPVWISEEVLIRYTMWTWGNLFLDVEVDAMLHRGVAPTVNLSALDKEAFREQSHPWFEELASGLTAREGENLQLRRASLADLERLMGLRATAHPGELLAYRDAGPALDTAPVA